MRAQARGSDSDSPFSSAPGGAAICISSGVPAIIQVGDYLNNPVTPSRTCNPSGIRSSELASALSALKFYKLTFFFLSALISQPVFSASVPKLSNLCPNGYRTDGSSGYCTPISSSKPAPQVVPKLTNMCPNGYRTDGSSGYCTPMSPSKPAPRVVPKTGSSCPSGFRTDGSSGYCTEN